MTCPLNLILVDGKDTVEVPEDTGKQTLMVLITFGDWSWSLGAQFLQRYAYVKRAVLARVIFDLPFDPVEGL